MTNDPEMNYRHLRRTKICSFLTSVAKIPFTIYLIALLYGYIMVNICVTKHSNTWQPIEVQFNVIYTEPHKEMLVYNQSSITIEELDRKNDNGLNFYHKYSNDCHCDDLSNDNQILIAGSDSEFKNRALSVEGGNYISFWPWDDYKKGCYLCFRNLIPLPNKKIMVQTSPVYAVESYTSIVSLSYSIYGSRYDILDLTLFHYPKDILSMITKNITIKYNTRNPHKWYAIHGLSDELSQDTPLMRLVNEYKKSPNYSWYNNLYNKRPRQNYVHKATKFNQKINKFQDEFMISLWESSQFIIEMIVSYFLTRFILNHKPYLDFIVVAFLTIVVSRLKAISPYAPS